MKKIYLFGILFLGILIGWINPIEGPLDWTYDEYASQLSVKSQKAALRASPSQEIKSRLFEECLEDDEDVLTLFEVTLEGEICQDK